MFELLAIAIIIMFGLCDYACKKNIANQTNEDDMEYSYTSVILDVQSK